MTRTAIRVTDLGKRYSVGGPLRVGDTFRDTIARKFSRPFAKGRRAEPAQEDFWALRDLTFDINEGDVVGIIGRNGAGKSTLLKIMSRITAPTVGRIAITGRIASLLEVGTGFHTELTGRENVHLNGAILGMSRTEIARKFDEIVDFAGVEKFIDTPVKRYSSGMMVRLAFAVAAQLEPDILVVDEVLAVGDAEFQDKCLGKMQELSGKGGRTVIFVSHQLGLVSRLCKRGLYLKSGQLAALTDVESAIARYVQDISSGTSLAAAQKRGDKPHIESIEAIDAAGTPTNNYLFDEPIVLRTRIHGPIVDRNTYLSVTIMSKHGDHVATSITELGRLVQSSIDRHTITVSFPANTFAPRDFSFRIGLAVYLGEVYDEYDGICPIKVTDNGSTMAKFEQYGYGHVILDCKSQLSETPV